eukprot:SAG31_NODE_197_length_20660_cov_8.861368_15_plen_93_part_00
MNTPAQGAEHSAGKAHSDAPAHPSAGQQSWLISAERSDARSAHFAVVDCARARREPPKRARAWMNEPVVGLIAAGGHRAWATGAAGDWAVGR